MTGTRRGPFLRCRAAISNALWRSCPFMSSSTMSSSSPRSQNRAHKLYARVIRFTVQQISNTRNRFDLVNSCCNSSCNSNALKHTQTHRQTHTHTHTFSTVLSGESRPCSASTAVVMRANRCTVCSKRALCFVVA